jgi:putative transposase
LKIIDICELLNVNRSSYYRNKNVIMSAKKAQRIQEEEKIAGYIKEIKSKHIFWGYRKIRANLKRDYKTIIGINRVNKIMKKHDLLVNIKSYKAKRTPQREKPKASKKNDWWGTDMTKFYVNTVGWLYFVVVLDWYTKKLIGYKLSQRCKKEEWIEALNMAVINECPLGSRKYDLNLMSDNGSQPTSIKYEKTVKTLEINHVTTSYNNPKGNGDTERFMRTFKEEAIWPNEFYSFEEAQKAVEEFVVFYNNEYPHSVLKYLSPVEFENLQKNVA